MPSSDGRPNVKIATGDQGQRLVSWVLSTTDGEVTVQHDFPDALSHHYEPAGVNEDVAIYEGPFTLPGDDRPYSGDVRWRWDATPRIEARGWREANTAEDLVKLLSVDSPSELWVQNDNLSIDLTAGSLPPQPEGLLGHPGGRMSSIRSTVEQQLGDGSDLDRVTFLVPNGWQGQGTGICSAADLQRMWHGRIMALGDGWTITLDLRQGMAGLEPWRQLKYRRGQQFTHIGELRRTDGSTFSGADAFSALDRVRLALNLALGRRVTCALPVGYRADKAVWCRWRSAPIDWYQDRSHWLDETIAHEQVGELLRLVLDFTADDSNLAALRAALGYYVAANVDVDVDLSVSVPISGLQLLAYYRFVTQRSAYSRNAWKDLDTEQEIRLLLDDIKVDTSVAPHFKHLESARARTSTPDKSRDALGAVMKMRNVVTHPTRDTPSMFSIYEWAEAGMHVRYWLCLALLHTVGYRGQVAQVHKPQPRWQGQVENPPWVP